jgi:glutamate-5-semialdehyde dehydrogenase
VHAYFDRDGDLPKGAAIIHNAKTRRVSVCNALDCLLIHESRLGDLFQLLQPMIAANVEIFADEKSHAALVKRYPDHLLGRASEKDFGVEFLSHRMAVKTVNSVDAAIDHIVCHTSGHSEAIITENAVTARYFIDRIDAAVVYLNASTAFTDGAQFGMGAEIGISTQKLHARGPMALDALSTYKWIVKGEGQVRT